MNTEVMVDHIKEGSPRLKARIAGLFYLMNFAFAPSMFANSRFVVSGDAVATATNLLAHEALFRLGFAGNLIAIASYIAVTALFYELFKPVNRTVSLLAAFFSLMGCAVLAVSCLFYVAPFVALGGAHYLSVFTVEQLQALALMFLKLYGQCFQISFVFFGLYCLLIGYLIFKSTFLPRILGVLMALAGLGWLTFLSPPFAHYLSPYILLSGIGEAALMLWLLAAGVNAERWKEQAQAARE
jgi:hypothetical protein